MKKSTFWASLLALFGFNLNSCNNEEEAPDEYGCPYVVFKAKGTVTDENNNAVEGAEVTFSTLHNVENDSTTEVVRNTIDIGITQSDGSYDIENSDFSHSGELKTVEIVTSKEGFEPDTTYLELSQDDFVNPKDWNMGTCVKQVDIKLKKED